jgi:hypothetical protein
MVVSGGCIVVVELFMAAQPRDDVLSGTLTEAQFAASLDEVVAGSAPTAYGDPEMFFASTYPSDGLRSLLDEVLGRVGGARPDGAPVVRLETNLGGGKTHNLIALYYAARGLLPPMRAMEFMDPDLLPPEPVTQIGVFVGTATGATSFPPVEGITPNTPWGYLALQLGGAGAYERIRTDDENLTAPGSHDLSEIMGGRPALVLIDEIARYLAVAQGRLVGESTLAKQTTAFVTALMEAVASQPSAALVLTTTQVTDAFGEQTQAVLDAITEAESLIARKEHVLRPSGEADLPNILARRLFAHIDDAARDAVGRAYADTASEAASRGTDLPERMTRPSFARDVARTYPFHPDLVTVLDKRLSTIPNFQRTRGALRLLARTVRLLWNAQPADVVLIHPHHIDLADRDTVEDLSSRLDKSEFEPVIRVDVASEHGGDPSHAEEIDARLGILYARELATACYLYSLTRDMPGVPASTLVGAVLAPGDDPNVIAKALDELESVAWYLHSDVRGYRFSTEASLPRLLHEYEQQVTVGKTRQKATDILAEQFKDSALKVRRTWEDAKVPDRDDDAWLVIVHWDDFGSEHGVAGPQVVPDQVREVWERTPAGGVREFRNRLVFLAPSSGSHDAMLRTVRRHLALEELTATPDALRSLSDEKRKELQDRRKASEMEARIAVCNHVNLLYVPQAAGLEGVELDVVTQASLKRNQTDAVLERLAAMEKTLAAGDKPLDPSWIRNKLGAQAEQSLATSELVRIFARRGDLKLVLDRDQLRSLVLAGIRNGVWEYHDTERGDAGWFTQDNPDAPVRLADDTLICPVGTAPKWEPEPLPPLPPVPPRPTGAMFEGVGKADHAVQTARQAALDAGKQQLRELHLAISEDGAGLGPELARLHSVVPASTPGATLTYTLHLGAQLGSLEHSLQVQFTGPPGEYQPLRTALEHVLRNHEATLKATVRAVFDPPLALSGEELADIRRRAGDTGPSKCTVTIVTEDAQ